MKRIIKKKVYDTDTAALVASVPHPNCHDSTGQSCVQELYRKKNGEFFLFLKGPRSDAVHNICIENEPHDKWGNIFVLPYDKAREWGEQELTAEQWLKIFEPDEDEGKAQIHVNLSKDIIAKLKKAAQMQGTTLSSLVERMAGQLSVRKGENMILTTKVEQIIVNSDFSEIRIPAGTQGTVIDIIIENGEAKFLLDFAEFGTYEWYDASEVEDT